MNSALRFPKISEAAAWIAIDIHIEVPAVKNTRSCEGRPSAEDVRVRAAEGLIRRAK